MNIYQNLIVLIFDESTDSFPIIIGANYSIVAQLI